MYVCYGHSVYHQSSESKYRLHICPTLDLRRQVRRQILIHKYEVGIAEKQKYYQQLATITDYQITSLIHSSFHINLAMNESKEMPGPTL